MKIRVVLFCLFHFQEGFSKTYTNYTLFSSVPLRQDHLDYLKNLPEQLTVDFWRYPGMLNKTVEVLIGPEDKQVFMRTMDEQNYTFTTVIEDVQSAFDKQTVKTYIRRNMASFDFQSFFRLNDIYEWLRDMAQKRPEEVKLLYLGKTFDRRDILGVRVILKGSKLRSAVVIEGGIHAREWISPAFVTYMLNAIVNGAESSNADLKKVALTYEWYFVPVINPDGYEYSFEKDRLWRKNRRAGYGVDINRNFDSGFGVQGVSRKRHKETYCGEYAFSERESNAIKYLVAPIKDRLEYYLGFHSYGQYLIIPYAFTKKHLDNYNEMADILDIAKQRISRKFGTVYTTGTAYDTVGYQTSGVSGDWVKQTYRVPYVVLFELRDSGRCGFALPPDKILPTCEETMEGVIYILRPYKKFQKLSNLYEGDASLNAASRSSREIMYVAAWELRDTGQHGFALPPNKILPTSVEALEGVVSILEPKTQKFQPLSNNISELEDFQIAGKPQNHHFHKLLFGFCVLVNFNILYSDGFLFFLFRET